MSTGELVIPSCSAAGLVAVELPISIALVESLVAVEMSFPVDEEVVVV